MQAEAQRERDRRVDQDQQGGDPDLRVRQLEVAGLTHEPTVSSPASRRSRRSATRRDSPESWVTQR